LNKFIELYNSKPLTFIADIGANHGGSLSKAKDLIYLAKESGADVAKFQHFSANSIVSDYGFKNLGTQSSHQANWKKSVYDVYKDASINLQWTEELLETCKKADIMFMTSPYSLNLIDYIDPFVDAYKIGSGDITWLEALQKVVEKDKPVLLATGASNENEVIDAMNILKQSIHPIFLMQCNTNYTADPDNFNHINLNVLKRFSELWPDTILGLSDHTKGHSTVLGSIAFGARVIEKHFTDNCSQDGPDHFFAMDPTSWSDMVDASNELLLALGDGNKKIEKNESETAVLQRRSIRLKLDLKKDDIISKDNIEALRPCPADAISPAKINELIGKRLITDKLKVEHLTWQDLL
jgi:sialic acid synthase SpsE